METGENNVRGNPESRPNRSDKDQDEGKGQ